MSSVPAAHSVPAPPSGAPRSTHGSPSGHGTPTAPTQYKLKFHGTGVDLAVITLKNILLTICTLGLYSFWGKVNVRKFLWHHTEFHGHRLTYHGTGKELLKGYAKVIGAVIVLNLLSKAMLVSAKGGAILAPVVGLAFLVLVPFAIYQSQRYLYSRTSWRGIRFGMAPDAKPFVKAFIRGYLLTLLTLGIYAPIWQNRLYRLRMSNSRLGTLQVRYTGQDKQVFSIFLRALPLIIVTLGIYFFWYSATISRYRSAHTWIGSPTLGAARGNLQLGGSDYFKLSLLNIACLICTFGLAMPWVVAHNMAFLLARFSFVGQLNLAGIAQVASVGSATGDGLADALDVGLGM